MDDSEWNEKMTIVAYNALSERYCRAVGRTDAAFQYAEQLELLAAEAKASAVQAEKKELVLKQRLAAARDDFHGFVARESIA